jgi:hypothetical protein
MKSLSVSALGEYFKDMTLSQALKLCHQDARIGDVCFNSINNIKSLLITVLKEDGKKIIWQRQDLETVEEWSNLVAALAQGFSFDYAFYVNEISGEMDDSIPIVPYYNAPDIANMTKEHLNIDGLLPKEETTLYIFELYFNIVITGGIDDYITRYFHPIKSIQDYLFTRGSITDSQYDTMLRRLADLAIASMGTIKEDYWLRADYEFNPHLNGPSTSLRGKNYADEIYRVLKIAPNFELPTVSIRHEEMGIGQVKVSVGFDVMSQPFQTI